MPPPTPTIHPFLGSHEGTDRIWGQRQFLHSPCRVPQPRISTPNWDYTGVKGVRGSPGHVIPAHLPEAVVGEGHSQAIQNTGVEIADKKKFFTWVTESHTFQTHRSPHPTELPLPRNHRPRSKHTRQQSPTHRGLLNIWDPSRQMFGPLQEHEQLVFVHLVPASPLEKDPPGDAEPGRGRGGQEKEARPFAELGTRLALKQKMVA